MASAWGNSFGVAWGTSWDIGSTPLTPPAPSGGNSGADSQWTPPQWLLDQLWDEELLKEEKKKLSSKIKKIAKKKRELQVKIAKPSQDIDYSSIIAAIQALASQMDELVRAYKQINGAIVQFYEEQEEDEMMLLLTIVSRTLH
jgi:hypothetical protein